MVVKKKPTKRKPTARKVTNKKPTRSKRQDAAGGYDTKSRKKYDRGGRVEAYTFGEALGGKNWP